MWFLYFSLRLPCLLVEKWGVGIANIARDRRSMVGWKDRMMNSPSFPFQGDGKVSEWGVYLHVTRWNEVHARNLEWWLHVLFVNNFSTLFFRAIGRRATYLKVDWKRTLIPKEGGRAFNRPKSTRRHGYFGDEAAKFGLECAGLKN